jgi:hypothetical protein
VHGRLVGILPPDKDINVLGRDVHARHVDDVYELLPIYGIEASALSGTSLGRWRTRTASFEGLLIALVCLLLPIACFLQPRFPEFVGCPTA